MMATALAGASPERLEEGDHTRGQTGCETGKLSYLKADAPIDAVR